MSVPFKPLRLPKTPTVGRYWGVLCLVLLPGRASAQAAEARVELSESQAVSRALSRQPLVDTVQAAIAIEAGRGRAAAAYPNPELSYVREQTFGSRGTGEDYLSISQRLDLRNRRGLASEAGEARTHAARSEGQWTRLELAAEARTRFYALLYRQLRAAALDTWVARIEAALGIVTRRELRGDAATYDRRRLERERHVAIARRELELSALERARARLSAIVGAPSASTVATGKLLPESQPEPVGALHERSRTRPDLSALRLRASAAERDGEAARRWFLPDLQLQAGWKAVNHPGPWRSDGFVLGASLALPLWDRGSAPAQIARAEGLAARARSLLLEAELSGELAGARAEAARTRRTALEFEAQSAADSSELVRIASAGYEGGELGLLELLDAYRGSVDDALTALEIAYAARNARIELDRISGVGAP